MTPGDQYGPGWLHQKISAGDIVIIDGAMGTELEARGVPMNDQAWSGAAVLSHPDVVKEAHADYIAAGAEVIIANTFASGRPLLERAGLGDEMARINQDAVGIAKKAREESGIENVAVAGSMCPWVGDGDDIPTKSLADAFQEQADILAAAGVDMIVLEMCLRPEKSRLIANAAVSTGLPVWLGLSCQQSASGQLESFDVPGVDFRAHVEGIVNCGASVVTIMHSTVVDTTMGLSVLQEYWDGPVGVYPESGDFVMPNWQFVDIIEPDALVESARGWVDDGVQILGGCCGLSVAHIRALKAAFG